MSIWGKIIGGVGGFAIGGPLGALLGGLAVELPSRQLQLARGQALSEPGWFAAGNVLGGFHGAQWCYFNGRQAARRVANFLE